MSAKTKSRSTNPPLPERRQSDVTTVFDDDQIVEVMDQSLAIVAGFESEDVISNLAAGQALARLLRSIAREDTTNSVLGLLTSILPMVANTLEDSESMARISDSLKIVCDAIESETYQRNAAAGVRFASNTLEDERIGKALASGMGLVSGILERPQINSAIETGGEYVNSVLSHPRLQTGVKRIIESPRVNRTLNSTVKTGVNVAQQLMKSNSINAATRAGMDVSTRVLNDETFQKTIKRTVSTGAYYTKAIIDNETIGAAANTSTNMALSILGSDVVTNAANSTWGLAKSVVTSEQVIASWGLLASTFDYFTTMPSQTVEEMERDLELLKEESIPKIRELSEEEAEMAREEAELRAMYEKVKSNLRAVRSQQVNMQTRIKVAEAQINVEKKRQLDEQESIRRAYTDEGVDVGSPSPTTSPSKK
eukprot:CFRG5968T1